MKRTNVFIASFFLISLLAASCGWKPSVSAVPITKPWSEMNLPVEKDAVVWGSTDILLKVAHKGSRESVADAYKKALEAAGFQMTKFDPSKNADYFTFENKSGTKLEMQCYDFENTGIIIDKVN